MTRQSTFDIVQPGAAARPDSAYVAQLMIDNRTPWRILRKRDVTLACAGYLFGTSADKLVEEIAAAEPDTAATCLAESVARLDGHFAIAASGQHWGFAAVDRVRSIPLFYARVGDTWIIDNRAERLRIAAGLDVAEIDPDAALAIGMAGYTSTVTTLYRGLEMLGPGEYVTFRQDETPRRRTYYKFQPWFVTTVSDEALLKRLTDVTMGVMEKHLASLNGRPLVVPLSAGNDSRLIASAARYLGYRDIRCFAYGRVGSFEVTTSRAVAEKLEVRWTFVPLTITSQRKYFQSSTYFEYLDFSDTCAAVPFVQDMSALQLLKSAGFLPDDAVIINGNTGDFISGNHIVPSLRSVPHCLTPDQRQERILSALVDKHFALWGHLRTPANLARIRKLLIASLDAAGAVLGDPEGDHGIYEFSEFQNRQCKYVINGQRIYEFLGYEWRLPLWDREYLDFWESVPLWAKVNQTLYVKMLRTENWGGVWHIPVNQKTIRPRWIVPLRLAAKLAHAPFGAERWHKFERRFFQYWFDPICSSACVSYWQAAKDRRGQRMSVSWLAEQYLAKHGVILNSLVR